MCSFLTTQATAYQNGESELDFLIKNLSKENGLPSNTVSDIHIASDGFLYAASNNGLIISDGHNWDIIDVESESGFDSNQILKIYELPNGSVLVQDQQNRLYRLNKSRQVIKYESNGGDINISALTYNDSLLYILTESDFYLYKDDVLIRTERIEITDSIWDMIFYDESLFIVTSTGVFEYKDSELVQVDRTNNNVNIKFYTQFQFIGSSLAIVGNGGLDCVQSMDSDECSKLSIPLDDEVELKNIKVINSDPNNLIIATNEGIFGKTNDTIDSINGPTGSLRFESYFNVQGDEYIIGSNGVWVNSELAFTPRIEIVDATTDGYSIWITADQEGIFQIQKNAFSHLSGKPFTNNYSIVSQKTGNLIAGSFEHGLTVFNESEVLDTFTKENTELPNNTIRMMAELSNGNTLVSTWGEPPQIFQANKFKSIQALQDLSWPITNVAEGFYEFPNNDWLIGTLDGLILLRNGEAEWIKKSNGENLKGVSRIATISETNELLLCTQFDGIYLFRYDAIYSLSESLPDYTKQVRDVFIQSADTFWAASYNSGLHRYVREEVGSISFNAEYFADEIGIDQTGLHSIIVDETGITWIPTNEGLLSFKFSDLIEAIEYEREIAGIELYTEDNGLLNAEFNGGSQNVSLIDSDGKIWLSNQSGLVYFNPEVVHSSINSTSQIYIRSIIGDQTNINFPSSDTLKIDHRDKSVQIEFAQINTTGNQTDNIWIKENDSDWFRTANVGSFITQPLKRSVESIQLASRPEATDSITIYLVRYLPFYATVWFRLLVISGIFSMIFYILNRRAKGRESGLTEELQIPKHSTKPEDSPAEIIENTIAENISNPEFNQKELANLLKMSRSTLYRQWSAEKEKSINEYILSLRLQKAIELLIEKDISITESAELSGFRTQSYFSKVFKKYYDMTPTEFVKSKKEDSITS